MYRFRSKGILGILIAKNEAKAILYKIPQIIANV